MSDAVDESRRPTGVIKVCKEEGAMCDVGAHSPRQSA